jgi:AcrR family transcriptional regulator
MPPLALGRPPLGQEVINRYRRERITIAIAEIAHERGALDLTTAQIISEARMSRNTFYDLFDSRAKGVEHAFQSAHKRLFGPVLAAGEEPKSRLARLSDTLDALFAAVVGDPLLAELCLVHSHGAGGDSGGFDYQAGLDTMAAALRGDRRAESPELGADQGDRPAGVEEFLAGAILSLTAAEIRQGKVKALPSLRAELIALAASFGIE